MLSKATVVTLPFVLLLLDYWPLRRFGRGVLSADFADERRLEERGFATKERREHKEKTNPVDPVILSKKKFSLCSLRSFVANASNVWKKEPQQPTTSNQQLYFFVVEKIPFFLLSAAMAVVVMVLSSLDLPKAEKPPISLNRQSEIINRQCSLAGFGISACWFQ